MSPSSSQEQPYRPIPVFLRPVRHILRQSRIARHKILLGKRMRVGKNVALGKKAQLKSPDYCVFGNNVAVGAYFWVDTNTRIGDEVIISSKVSFVGNDHSLEPESGSIYWAGRLPSSTVVLEGDNFIGFGVIVLGDVTIGRGCVVGAGAVVTHDLPPNTICAGVPAKVIRARRSGPGSAV